MPTIPKRTEELLEEQMLERLAAKTQQEMLDQIDTGKKTIDSPSWRLLKPELR